MSAVFNSLLQNPVWAYFFVFFEWAYILFIIFVAVRIIRDTRTSSKTLAYLLLIILFPIAGVIIYFVFGVNYRKNQFFSIKVKQNEIIYNKIYDFLEETNTKVYLENESILAPYQNMIQFLFNSSRSPVVQGNEIEILVNGEEKFKKVFEVLRQAKHHIHIEYYIYEDDDIGTQLGNLLIEKAREGVIVRMLYDAFGSNKLSNQFIQKLRDGGVQAYPVNKIRFRKLANRINYRDHRKIIVIDGHEVFSGGINVSDKYINTLDNRKYWRDTHMYIKGSGVFYFQYLFLSQWIFATKEEFEPQSVYFPKFPKQKNKLVQVAASGPDTRPAILHATMSAIYAAKKQILITTPYFVPDNAVKLALKYASLSGVKVQIIVPKIGDSRLVNAAASSYFNEMMEAGVEIFLYYKGFVHAKTMVVDDTLSMIGTANMDVRSFELNFEVNTHIYDEEIAAQMTALFKQDLEDCYQINPKDWRARRKVTRFGENLARLFSPLF